MNVSIMLLAVGLVGCADAEGVAGIEVGRVSQTETVAGGDDP
jgi:hypothetical protein